MNRPSHYRQSIPTVQCGDIAALYRSRDTDPLAAALGALYAPPTIFEHGRETLVALIPASDSGQEVHLFETRRPDATYAIECRGLRLETGSDWRFAKVAGAIALEIARGALDPANWQDVGCRIHELAGD